MSASRSATPQAPSWRVATSRYRPARHPPSAHGQPGYRPSGFRPSGTSAAGSRAASSGPAGGGTPGARAPAASQGRRRLDDRGSAIHLFPVGVLAVLVLAILLGELENVADYFAAVGAVAGLFCAASLVVGYVVPKALGITEAQAIASSMEIGVHNATLAIFVAVEVFDSVEISVPAAVYSLFMFVFAALWGVFVSRRVAAAEATRASA